MRAGREARAVNAIAEKSNTPRRSRTSATNWLAAGSSRSRKANSIDAVPADEVALEPGLFSVRHTPSISGIVAVASASVGVIAARGGADRNLKIGLLVTHGTGGEPGAPAALISTR